MKLLPSWDKLLKDHWKQMESDNVVEFDTYKPLQKIRTLSLVFKVPSEASQKIRNSLDEIVPDSLKERVLFQPWRSYHFTVQWSPSGEIKDKNLEQITKELESLFSKFPPIKGEIVFPFFGVVGLLGFLRTKKNREFPEIRDKINKSWSSFGLSLGAKKYLEKYPGLAYLSLSRYTGVFNHEEKHLLKNLPTDRPQGVCFKEALLVLNDKFMTPKDTEIFAKLKLGGE